MPEQRTETGLDKAALAEMRRRPRPKDGSSPCGPDASGIPWTAVLNSLRIQLDPVVDIHSGQTLGLGVLPEAYRGHGAFSLEALEQQAWEDGVLALVQTVVLTRAVKRLETSGLEPRPRLFARLAPAFFEPPTGQRDDWSLLLDGLDAARIDLAHFVLTIPEDRLTMHKADGIAAVLHAARDRGARIGVTSFGTGGASLPILHRFQPDYVQLGGFFLRDLAQEPRKKIFLRHLAHIAHLAGSLVIAGGLQDQALYFACRDAGCDLIRGPLITEAAPGQETLAQKYEGIAALAAAERRSGDDRQSIADQCQHLVPLPVDASMETVFERFRRDKNATFFPVIDRTGAPLGLIREQELKEYAFSRYGRDLIHNRTYGRKLAHFLKRCPVADIHRTVEDVLEIFSADSGIEGILISEDGCYAGFLSAGALLRLINEKNLATARDENPLTRLPGNTAIQRFLAKAAEDRACAYCLIYFDFDCFKPFNDTYGFRQGDRAIQDFADLLRAHFQSEQGLIGHVGGDDFFAGLRNTSFATLRERLTAVLAEFRARAASFYEPEIRHQGFYLGKDREGTTRQLPLLTASAAVVDLPPHRSERIGLDEIAALFAPLKKQAKAADDHLAAASPTATSQAA